MNSKSENKIILWLEDNPQDSMLRFIPKSTREHNLRLIQVPGVSGLRLAMDEIGDLKRVRGVILDIMLHGAKDLGVFGHPEIQWKRGDDTGFRLLEWVLRNPKDYKDLAKVPILVLTVKPTVREKDFKCYGAGIELIHKFARNTNWESRVKQWLVSRASR